MTNKIATVPITKGLKNNVEAFNIDNDSFPQLLNAYQWRDRIRRKRGTQLIGRLQRYFDSTSASYNSGSTTITLDGDGDGNLLTGFSLETNASIKPGSVNITAGGNPYDDSNEDGTLSPSGSINYASGDITILAEANNNASATFIYHPNLPVMGERDFENSSTQYAQEISFDTVYSYFVNQANPFPIHDISFYTNPATGAYPNYVEKTIVTPTSWNGQDYQLFQTINYQGAMWATNGVTVPFSSANFGMHFATILNITIDDDGTASNVYVVTITTSAAHGLVIGDFVYINEVDVDVINGINFKTGYVTAVPAVNMITVTFENVEIDLAFEEVLTGTEGATSGIVQYLTNRSNTALDCLRWFNGDPTNGSETSPVFNTHLGWVNFCPPISQLNFSIGNLPPAIYYLVGAKKIYAWKDRIIFFGPIVQTSTENSQVYLPDMAIWSQNGTPYYTCTFNGDPRLATTLFVSTLTPQNETGTATAFFSDSQGYGGFQPVGLDQAINTVDPVGDMLILGMDQNEVKMGYTGNDIVPFNYYLISTDKGTTSPFSSIDFEEGILSRGDRGYIITNQTNCQRFDLDIPQEVFQTSLNSQGTQRVAATRDYINQWVHFSYPYDGNTTRFPARTLQYNYIDKTWAIFNESFTCYGDFRERNITWATVGRKYPTWKEWNVPWNQSGSQQIQSAAGNQQGFLMLKGVGTGESPSLYIQDLVDNVVTSVDHGLQTNDYIVIQDALELTNANGNIFSILKKDEDSFSLNPAIVTGTYMGNGTIKRMYVPFIQTKQFPVGWGSGQKTLLGAQKYLFSKTNNGQVTLYIYLSQNDFDPYNDGPILTPDVVNSSLIYSTLIYTCPELTNIGLTAPNINLNQLTGAQQNQIWHRKNTSLLGDTVQLAITLNDEQMRNINFDNQFEEIEFHGFILDVSPSMVLA